MIDGLRHSKAIDKNVCLIETKAKQAIDTHSRFANEIGYPYLRKER